MGELIGYARVSTDGQSNKQQEAELRAAGCTRIFADKASGASKDRPELKRLIDFLRPGDCVVVCKLDRLGRNTLEMLEICRDIAAAEATFRSIAEPWADTTSPAGSLILTVMAGVAEFERARMRERQRAGIDRARRNGELRDNGLPKYAGRPRKKDRAAILRALEAGEGATAISNRLGCSRRFVYVVRDDAASPDRPRPESEAL